MDDTRFNDIFGADNLNHYSSQFDSIETEKRLLAELNELNDELKRSFHVELTLKDYLVSGIAGVMLGLSNALFKNYIPQKGPLKHKHSTTRTAVDYKVPKPEGYKGSVQGLHRQIGPSHDIFRFKEALDLMSGQKNDFPLWGSTLTQITGVDLRPGGGMSVADFLTRGGFKIPADPKKELVNHLLIDFFTKTSLPIPGTTLLADNNQFLAKIMLQMYDEGLNLKNLAGNSMSFAILQTIMHGYAFLFKALPSSKDTLDLTDTKTLLPFIKDISSNSKDYLKSNEFHVQQIIAHGSSFIIDSAITVGSQNYSGIFSLNYASLIVFLKHSIQYSIQGYRKYNDSKQKINLVEDNLLDTNEQWYTGFKENVITFSESENFQRIISPELDLIASKSLHSSMDNISKQANDRLSQIKELNDWSDFHEKENK